MIAEKVVENFKDAMNIHIIRPATVCGVSPRMRLDVSVNMFTFQAMKFKMSVFGGNQIRPNIHINDIVGVFFHFLRNPEIKTGAYNAGFGKY